MLFFSKFYLKNLNLLLEMRQNKAYVVDFFVVVGRKTQRTKGDVEMKKGDVIEVPQLTEEQKQAKAKQFEIQKEIIDLNTGSFWKIGSALAKIRGDKLFLGVGAGDEIEVGKKYWGYTKGYITQRIQAAEVMDRLDEAFTNRKPEDGEAPQMPTNEYQCRMLRKNYPAAEWVTTWERLVKEFGRVPTGDEIASNDSGDAGISSNGTGNELEEEKTNSLEKSVDLDILDFSDSMTKIDEIEIDVEKLDGLARAEMLKNVKKAIAKLEALAVELERANGDEN